MASVPSALSDITRRIRVPVGHMATVGDQQHIVNVQTSRRQPGVLAVDVQKRDAMGQSYVITGSTPESLEQARHFIYGGQVALPAHKLKVKSLRM